MTKSDTHSPVLVRMENALKAALQHAAVGNGRTLTKEINTRLRASLAPGQPQGIAPRASALYPLQHGTTVLFTNENGPAPALTDHDRAMLDIFHKLTPDKQLALLSLFR